MATVTQDVREQASLVEIEPSNNWVFFLADSAELGDAVYTRPAATILESVQLNEILTDKVFPVVRDAAQLVTRATIVSRRVVSMRETAKLRSRSSGGVNLTSAIRETAELNDQAPYDLAYTLRDTATLNDTASTTRLNGSTMREVAALKSRAVSPISFTVRESAAFNDAVSLRGRLSQNLRELAQLSEVLSYGIESPASIRDAATFVARRPKIVHNMVGALRDRGYPEGVATPPPYGRAYTCSVITWAMSTFSNYSFPNMAGKYASGNNLWRLGGDDDYGNPITSYIKTGLLDMGADQFKRLSAVYVSGQSDSPLTVTVTGDVNGSLESYDYDLQLRDQTDFRNNRALVGKGFRSRYVQVKIGGTSVQYTLLSASADVATATRRV